ncbi:MAG: 5,10-methylenetetrahydrofolate reductase [Actinobacteria bacterium]|nr:MAG: 5,10-methylenetetrahydrofolate reductase [Actinomycetota bacterium]
MPHLAARMITDRSHLGAILDAITSAGITRTFVIGGDAPEPGKYLDALSLLRDMDDLGHPFGEIGIACYPEGHAVIPSPPLLQALRDKEEYASYMTTQMCFDPNAIVDWITARRADGIALPVHLGVPGVAELTKLVTLSARIGIGDSRRYLAKNSRLIGRLVRPGGFSADGLLDALGSHLAGPSLAIEGIHLFTFNQVADTEEWRHRYLETLRHGHENEETA